ncbi:MAG: hypothetical protein WBO70_08095 [Erysipelotrichaceae bacterium]
MKKTTNVFVKIVIMSALVFLLSFGIVVYLFNEGFFSAGQIVFTNMGMGEIILAFGFWLLTDILAIFCGAYYIYRILTRSDDIKTSISIELNKWIKDIIIGIVFIIVSFVSFLIIPNNFTFALSAIMVPLVTVFLIPFIFFCVGIKYMMLPIL